FVNAAVVFRNLEAHRQPAVGTRFGLSQCSGRVGEPFSAKAEIVLNDPAAVYRSPEQVDFLMRCQPFCSGLDIRADYWLRFRRVLPVSERELFRRLGPRGRSGRSWWSLGGAGRTRGIGFGNTAVARGSKDGSNDCGED